jgi:hypothetical protein
MRNLTLLTLAFVTAVGCGCSRDPYADLSEKQVKDATKQVRPLSGNKPFGGKGSNSKEFFHSEVPPPTDGKPVTVPLGDPPK